MIMTMDKNKTISRRNFFKQIGAASVAVAGFSACGKGNKAKNGSAEPLGEMTHRTLTGDHVSLLGYGCMRWPMLPSADGKSEVIDQETVNGLVDYALAHGVNYFDTAPPYCQGLSEEATGIALSRHPRDSYYIATKMSNHRLYGAGLRGKELHDASVKMYRNSFKSLRTDYFDSGKGRYDGSLLEWEIDYSSAEIESYLIDAGLMPELGDNFENVKFFGVSAFNFDESIHSLRNTLNKAEAVRFECSAKRLELPFIWMLRQFSVIK